MTTAENIRIEYQPDLYVPREEAEAEVQKWLESNGRLLTITSPPATGKSWLLKRIREAFLPGVPSFWLDVREFLTPAADSPIASRRIDNEKLAQWLTQFLQKERETCAGVPEYDAGVETAVLLEKFAEAAQQCHPRQKLYLLVEGGDEPIEEAWYTIERQILEPIARIPDWRFVIVLRLEQKLQTYMLRRSQQRLVLGTLPQTDEQEIVAQGREQIEKLRLAELAQHPDLPDTSTILSLLPKYPWSHLGINRFIFLEVKANHRASNETWLVGDYRFRCLCAIMGLPTEYVNGLHTHLNEIVNHLRTGWTPDELVLHFGWSNSQALDRIEEMRSAGLVENVSRNRFQITNGVREFLL